MTDLPVSLSVLGSMELRDAEPGALGGPQPRRLLAVLAVHANAVVSTDRLIDVLWGDAPPASALHTLQNHVSRLRAALGPERIETVAPGYRLRIDPDELDSLQFDALVRTAFGCLDRPAESAALLSEALALWRGLPYAEFADEEFASVEVTRLAELRVCAVEERAAALVELGREREVIAALEAEIAAEPLRERLRGVWMLALARADRPVEALHAFDAYRRLLADEFGVVPSVQLQALNDDILRQHPDLGWESPSGSRAAVHEMPGGTLTFLFTDLEGSTRLWQEHPDAMAPALARHDAILRHAVEGNCGVVVKTTGDGVHAVFANATDAIEAGIAAQLALRAEPWAATGSLRVRMGVHTGETSQRDGDYYGPAVNQAARLMGTAHGGQLVCSGVVADLTGERAELLDLGLHRLPDVESPLRVFQVLAPGLEARFPPLRSLDATRSNLPVELSRLVGRADDVTAVVKGLAECPVVSIVGAGGVGKTRLALQVGSDLRSAYADGVWWCELAALRDPDVVPEAVAAALGYVPAQGASTTGGLVEFFRHKHLLLVLDNCEHLLDATAEFVSEIGAESPRLSVLTTSREALAIRVERVYALPPLELPVDTTPASVGASEAGALFATRARGRRESFVVTDENAAAISKLCARLDGNALAIELAAARTSMMSPAEILSRLDQRFRLLANRDRDVAERHQTLYAAIDWSYALLDPREQAGLRWFSVFVGDFDLGAATRIAAHFGLDEYDAIDVLGSLVAKSLVEHTETVGLSRYRLLETVRQYAAERLDTEGETERARDVHATHYRATGGELFAMLRTADDFDALERLGVETPNVAAALRWLLATDHVHEVLAFLADADWIDGSLLPFALLDELGRLAREALGRPGVNHEDGYLAALFHAGARAFYVGDWEQYRQVAEAGSEIEPDSKWLLNLRIGAAAMRGDMASAISIGQAGVELARRAGDRWWLSYMLATLAVGEGQLGFERALADAEEGVEVARGSAARSTLIFPLCMFAMVATERDPDRALAAAQESIRLDRTQRKAWSTVSEGIAAKLRVERGEVCAGLELWRDVLQRLDWSGERGYLALQLPALAGAIADREPLLALELVAISEGGAVGPFAALEGPGADERLVHTVERLGADALRGARARAASMSYDEALGYVFDNIDRLIGEVSAGPP